MYYACNLIALGNYNAVSAHCSFACQSLLLEHVVNLQVPSLLCCLLVGLTNGFLRGLFILNLCLRDMIKIAIT